jgi:20S proteasome alpha/beta subunit
MEDQHLFLYHSLIFFGVDDEKGPQVLKVEPSGHFSGYYV